MKPILLKFYTVDKDSYLGPTFSCIAWNLSDVDFQGLAWGEYWILDL